MQVEAYLIIRAGLARPGLFLLFIWFVWLNETNQINQINQTDQRNQMNLSRSPFTATSYGRLVMSDNVG